MSGLEDSNGSQDMASQDGSVATPGSPSSLSEGEVDGIHHQTKHAANVHDEQSEVLSSLRQYGQGDDGELEEESDMEDEEESSQERDDIPPGALLSSSVDFGTDSEAEERAKDRFFQKLEQRGMLSSQDGKEIHGEPSRTATPTSHLRPEQAETAAPGGVPGPQSGRKALTPSEEALTATDEHQQLHDVLHNGPLAATPSVQETTRFPAASAHPKNAAPTESGPTTSGRGVAASAPDPSSHTNYRPPVSDMPPPSNVPRRPDSQMRRSFPADGKPALEQLRPQPLQIVDDVSIGARVSPIKSTPGSRARPLSTDSRRQSAAGGGQRLGAVQSGNLSSKVEELRAQVAEERAARQAVQQKLTDLRKEAERNEKKIKEELEARVREAQRSRAALQQRVAELEGGTAKERLARGGPEVVLSGEELRALRQEVAEQEALIQGYQAENEKLVERIKEMQKQYKSERQELQREHERLAGHLAQVENETHTQQSSADVAAHLQKILQLEAELEAVKSAAASREVELKFEIDRARQGRKELENRYAGLDPQKMAQEDHALAQANQALAAEQEAHLRAVALLEAKLQWYTENQEIVTQQDETIKMQASRILDLEAQLRASSHVAADPSAPPDPAKTRAAAVAPAKATARIRQLEKQVKVLEGSLAAQRADPNSLAALIQATRGQEDEEITAMQVELEQLRAAYASKDDEASKALRGLRQEHERIKRQYEERIRGLREQLQERAAKKADKERAASAGRVKELEKQVEELRAFYAKKVKDLQRKLEEAGKAGPKGGNDGGSGTPVRTPGGGTTTRAAGLARELARAKEKATQLEDVLARKEAALAALQKEGEQAKGTKARGPDFQPDQVLALQQEVAQLRAENQQLQAQLQDRGRQANGYPSIEQGENRQERPGSGRGGWGASSSWLGGVDQRAKGEGWIEEVVALQRRAELAEMSRDLAQRQCTEAIEKAAVLRLQHQQTVARLQEAHAARLAALEHGEAGEEGAAACPALRERLQEAEQARAALQQEVDRLTAQLHSGRHGPPSVQLAALERRLSEMDEKQRSREARWKAVVADTQRILQEEAEAEREQWAAAIKAKNAEILRFRAELDDILSMATDFQAQRVEPVH